MSPKNIFFLVIDVVVNATNARPIRVACRDAEGSQEVPLGSLHRIVARDPPLGLALLRGLHDWETSRVVSGIWVAPRRFRPAEWARMQEVGYAGGEDEEMWGNMGGGGVSEGEGGEEGGGRRPPPPPRPPPPQAKPNPPPTRQTKTKVLFRVVRRKPRRGDPPTQKAKNPHTTTTARPTKAVPAPKPTNPPKAATTSPAPHHQDRPPQGRREEGLPSRGSDHRDGRPRTLPPKG